MRLLGRVGGLEAEERGLLIDQGLAGLRFAFTLLSREATALASWASSMRSKRCSGLSTSGL